MAGCSMAQFELPTPIHSAHVTCRQVADELAFADTQEKRDELAREVAANKASMSSHNPDQLSLFNDIVRDIDGGFGRVYFIDAPAGTGKTFLSKTLLARVRQDRNVAIAVASSGIAATLLPGGRTAHSRFKMPLDPDETSTCNITQLRSDQTRAVIAEAKLILWDEVPMTHRFCFEALDRTLRKVLERDEPFGGKVVIFLGDFRQCLPVVKRAPRYQIVDATLKRSPIWQHIRVCKLTKNMRVELSGGQDRDELRRFAEFLIRVGDGDLPTIEDLGSGQGWIKLDDYVRCVPTEEDLKAEVFGELATRYHERDWLFNRALLAARNSVVDVANESLTAQFPGDEAVELLSADEVGKDDDATLFPVDFLNSLTVNGLPPHRLLLKVGMPVMVLRNLPTRADSNGTRYIVDKIHGHHLIEVVNYANGVERRIMLSRTVMSSKEGELPFTLRRRQFPIRPAFAMTINKAQGQTLKKVGVILPKPVFSHGQLYVALSRVGKPEDIAFWIDDSTMPEVAQYANEHPGKYTRNVVYKEVLQ